MKAGSFNLRKACLGGGVILIILSLIVLLVRQISVYCNEKKIRDYVDILYELIPEPRPAVAESRSDNTMPSLSLRGQNFVAIMEMPEFGVSLPVGASWRGDRGYPCRYAGSVYDGSLVIGATNQKGQLAFVKEILVGNTVYITDMTGNRYAFEVSDISYSRHADNDSLNACSDDLTLFVKNIYAFEYIIIRCNASGM